jgi:hypothetical protein
MARRRLPAASPRTTAALAPRRLQAGAVIGGCRVLGPFCRPGGPGEVSVTSIARILVVTADLARECLKSAAPDLAPFGGPGCSLPFVCVGNRSARFQDIRIRATELLCSLHSRSLVSVALGEQLGD